MACRNSVPVLLMSFSPTVHFKFFSSWSFFRIFFSEVLFRLPYIISSNQLPVVFPVCYSCHIFPIRVQLLHSYNLYQMSHSQFSSLLDCFPNSVPLILLMSCTPTVKFPIFSLYVPLLLLFQFSSFLPFFASFSLALISARQRHLTEGIRNHTIGRPRSTSLLFPLAADFLYCHTSLTFSSTLYFPKFQSIITRLLRLPIIYHYPRVLIFRGARTNSSVPHAGILDSHSQKVFFSCIQIRPIMRIQEIILLFEFDFLS